MRWLAPPPCIPFSSLKKSMKAKKRLAPSCQSGPPRVFKRSFCSPRTFMQQHYKQLSRGEGCWLDQSRYRTPSLPLVLQGSPSPYDWTHGGPSLVSGLLSPCCRHLSLSFGFGPCLCSAKAGGWLQATRWTPLGDARFFNKESPWFVAVATLGHIQLCSPRPPSSHSSVWTPHPEGC